MIGNVERHLPRSCTSHMVGSQYPDLKTFHSSKSIPPNFSNAEDKAEGRPIPRVRMPIGSYQNVALWLYFQLSKATTKTSSTTEFQFPCSLSTLINCFKNPTQCLPKNQPAQARALPHLTMIPIPYPRMLLRATQDHSRPALPPHERIYHGQYPDASILRPA